MTKAIATKSPTLEGQLLEILQEFQRLQRDPEINPDRLEPISLTINRVAGVAGFAGTIPIEQENQQEPRPVLVKSLFEEATPETPSTVETPTV